MEENTVDGSKVALVVFVEDAVEGRTQGRFLKLIPYASADYAAGVLAGLALAWKEAYLGFQGYRWPFNEEDEITLIDRKEYPGEPTLDAKEQERLRAALKAFETQPVRLGFPVVVPA